MLAGTWLDIILSIEVDFRWAVAATNPWGPFISILRNVDVILSVPTPHGLTISHLTILPDPETTLSIQSLVKGSSLTTPGHDRCRSPSNRPHISLSWAGKDARCVPKVILGQPTLWQPPMKRVLKQTIPQSLCFGEQVFFCYKKKLIAFKMCDEFEWYGR